MEILLLILIFGGWAVIGSAVAWFSTLIKNARKYKELKSKLDNLDQREHTVNERASHLDEREKDIITLSKQKAIGFPWLAEAYAEYFYLEEMKLARALETKRHPAFSAAEKVREAAKRRRDAERMVRLLKYQIAYYEALFPWLIELKSEDVEDELIQINSGGQIQNEDDDPAKKWLTPEEYNRLSLTKKYQLALDRYWSRKKSKWEVGRDYERFIGFNYESHGCLVKYQGILDGFEDLGRDLIAIKGNQVRIVQCKYWAKSKTIHEKHIFQLYGTFVAYALDHPDQHVKAHFVTSTSLSETAKKFAQFLGIKVTENLPLERYPCIKCNISK